jgi:anthranilate/para-aminobenzoate synthase component I
VPLTLLRRELAVTVTPEAAFRALYATAENAFWLDSGMHAAHGMSYLGASDVVERWHSWAELFDGTGDFGSLPIDRREPPPDQTRDAPPGVPRFRLGWVGWLAYELGTLDEERAGHAPHPAHPLAVFLRVDRAIEFDHERGSVALLALDAEGVDEWFDATERALADAGSHTPTALARTSSPPAPHATATVASVRHSFDDYERLVNECKRIIERGDAYQLCLTNEFTVDVRPDPFETYLRLREASPSHHSGFVKIGDTALLSSSPEQFLAVAPDRTVTTRPIKGTRPRGSGPVEDALLVRELAASEKERAENLMIVDLMRNDLARVSTVGSVQVTQLLEVETYRHVHQLVSTVVGELADGVNGLDAVAAGFPAGSMTGAPKRSAIAHLAALEQGERGIYSGAFGYLSFDGSIDLAMVIRSIVLTPGGASVGAGGGITALSDAADEVAETRVKAAALLAVLGARAPGDEENDAGS